MEEAEAEAGSAVEEVGLTDDLPEGVDVVASTGWSEAKGGGGGGMGEGRQRMGEEQWERSGGRVREGKRV